MIKNKAICRYTRKQEGLTLPPADFQCKNCICRMKCRNYFLPRKKGEVIKPSTEAEVIRFYQNATGVYNKMHQSRIIRIMQALEKWGLSVNDVALESHTDKQWNLRRARTSLEREAIEIGVTNSKTKGYTVLRYWLIPKI